MANRDKHSRKHPRTTAVDKTARTKAPPADVTMCDITRTDIGDIL